MTCRSAAHDPRRRLYALLQVGRQALGWSDDTYRDFLRDNGARGERSSATTMSIGQLHQALEAMRALGFRPRRRDIATRDWRGPRVAKITALWCTLADAGVVRDRSERAMISWCASMTGTARLEWADSEALNRCIEGLKAWASRERVAIGG